LDSPQKTVFDHPDELLLNREALFVVGNSQNARPGKHPNKIVLFEHLFNSLVLILLEGRRRVRTPPGNHAMHRFLSDVKTTEFAAYAVAGSLPI
jgi:hypothetical protein